MAKNSLPSSPLLHQRGMQGVQENLVRGCDFSVAKGSWQVTGVRQEKIFTMSGSAMPGEGQEQSLNQPGCRER